MASSKKKAEGACRFCSRVLLVQVLPLMLMLFVGSWLTLMAGQLIDQKKTDMINGEQVKIHLSRF